MATAGPPLLGAIVYIYRQVRLSGSWLEDDDAAVLCYGDPDPEQVTQPLVGMYGAVDDARRELLRDCE